MIDHDNIGDYIPKLNRAEVLDVASKLFATSFNGNNRSDVEFKSRIITNCIKAAEDLIREIDRRRYK